MRLKLEACADATVRLATSELEVGDGDKDNDDDFAGVESVGDPVADRDGRGGGDGVGLTVIGPEFGPLPNAGANPYCFPFALLLPVDDCTAGLLAGNVVVACSNWDDNPLASDFDTALGRVERVVATLYGGQGPPVSRSFLKILALTMNLPSRNSRSP